MSTLDRDELVRYSRHVLLPGLGLAGQERLKQASVLCIGAGGLSSPALLYLAAAGVGRIGIIDHDAVDVSNLQRQVLYGTSSVGTPKVEAARDRLRDLNPHVDIAVFAEALTSENALRVLAGFDVILDGSDNFPTRYLVDDACVLLGKPYVHGSIYRFEGQVSVFNHEGGPVYRDLYPEPPPPGAVPSCAEGGVLGVLPGVIGAIQATEALKLLVGLGTSLAGRLLVYDALAMRFLELGLRRDPARAPITRLVDYDAFCGFPGRPAHGDELTPAAFAARWAAGWRPLVLDVRSEAEAALARLPHGDLRIPVDDVAGRAGELPREGEIVVYCRSGLRSARAAQALRALGFTHVTSLAGGLLAWARDVDPTLAL